MSSASVKDGWLSARFRETPSRIREARYARTLVVGDATAAAVGTTAALLAQSGADLDGARQRYAVLSAVLPVVWVGLVAASRAYEPRQLFVGVDEYQRVLRAAVGLVAAVAVSSYLLDAAPARGYLVTFLIVTVTLTLGLRLVLRKRLHRARRSGAAMRRVLAVGHPEAVAGVVRQLHREYHHGLQVVAACGPLDPVPDAIAASRADTVVVLSCPELDGSALRRLAWQIERDGADLIVASALLDVAGDRITVRPVDGLPMLHVEHPRLSGARRTVKNVFDGVGAALLMVGLAPLLLAIAVVVRLGSPGPVLFRQRRVGRDGRPFTMFKFRTMHVDAEARLAGLLAHNDGDGVLFKIREDPRVTRVGRWLRRYSFDELPQLINVLLGDMSLVGPRPPLPAEVAAYPEEMHRRLLVKPGITGLWQVSGRADLPWEEAIRLDLRYVENWSLSLDLVILLRTVPAVLRPAGAY